MSLALSYAGVLSLDKVLTETLFFRKPLCLLPSNSEASVSALIELVRLERSPVPQQLCSRELQIKVSYLWCLVYCGDSLLPWIVIILSAMQETGHTTEWLGPWLKVGMSSDDCTCHHNCSLHLTGSPFASTAELYIFKPAPVPSQAPERGRPSQ